jgi:hypothetical protein
MPVTIEALIEPIYQSLHEDNKDIDTHIKALKQAMIEQGQKDVALDPLRIAQNNRQGRKTLQAYFKKRGVSVVFSAEV